MKSALKSKKILIVDDEQTMVDIVREILNRAGAAPFGANTIEKARHTLETERLDAVILDRYIDGDDGLDLLQNIKNTPETKTLPVVMLTGEKGSEEVQKSLKMGAVGYIVKPFAPKSFLGQLEKILDRTLPLDF